MSTAAPARFPRLTSAISRIKDAVSTPGEAIGNFVGKQTFGTGIDADGQVTGKPLNENTLAGQSAAVAGNYLNYSGNAYETGQAIGRGVAKIAGSAGEYITGADIVNGGPVDPAPAVAPEQQANTIVTAQPAQIVANQPTQATPAQVTMAPIPIAGPEENMVDPGALESFRSDLNLTGFKPAYEGQSVADYVAYRDDPAQATIQATDAQGRLRRFSSEAAVAQDLEEGRLAYEQGPASPAPRNPLSYAISDRERRGDTISMADATDITGSRKAGRAMIVQRRNGLDPASQAAAQADAELSRRKDYADHTAAIQQDANAEYSNNRAITEASAYGYDGQDPVEARRYTEQYKQDKAFTDRYGERIARAEAQLGRPLNSPDELFDFEFNQDSSRLSKTESAYHAATNDLKRIQTETLGAQADQLLSGDEGLAEQVNEIVSGDPTGRNNTVNALRGIASRGGPNAAAAQQILESSVANAGAILSEDPNFAETQKFAQELYRGIILDSQKAGIATDVGVPTYTPSGVSTQQFNAAANAILPN